MPGEFYFGIREHAERVLTSAQQILQEAVAIVAPENGETDPLKVFPAPNIVRAEDEGLPLTEEQNKALFENAAQLGFGRPENVTLSEQGLQGAYVILEGGQVHKMAAELDMVVRDENARPDHILMAASNERQITKEDETDITRNLLGRVGQTEYDVALDVLSAFLVSQEGPNYRELPVPIPWRIGYNPETDFTVSEKPSGQFQQVGAIEDVPVVMYKIDGKPGPDKTIEILSSALKLRKISDEVPIAFVTSGVYRPSREVAVALASLEVMRPLGIATYGNDLVNQVRGTDNPPPINQLPGELHKMAAFAVRLEQKLAG